MIDMDSYAYRSKLKHQDALQKLLVAGLMMVICLWASHMVIALAIFLFMSALTVIKGQIPLAAYGKALLIPAGFLLMGSLSLLIDRGDSRALFVLALPCGSHYIGIVKGSSLMVSRLLMQALAMVTCLYYIAFNTPMIDLLAGLKRLKVPPLIIELLGLIYRFIYIILAESNVIFIAQRSRLGYSSYRRSFRSFGTLVATVFVRSYRRFDHLYTALEARGYEGTLYVLEDPTTTERRDLVVPLMAAGCLIMLTLWLHAHS